MAEPRTRHIVETFVGFTRHNMPHRLLKEGDQFTIIEKLPVLREDETPVDVGDIIVKWFDTGESGRKFRVTKVHAPATYETVFVGFETFEVKQ